MSTSCRKISRLKIASTPALAATRTSTRATDCTTKPSAILWVGHSHSSIHVYVESEVSSNAPWTAGATAIQTHV